MRESRGTALFLAAMMVLSVPAVATAGSAPTVDREDALEAVLNEYTDGIETRGPVTASNGELDISGLETNSPVPGELLYATVTVENTGNATANETVELLVNGSRVDADRVSVAGGGTGTVTLKWQTDTADAGVRTVAVQTADDSASTELTLAGDNATTLHGRVTDSVTGEPVQGAHIRVLRENETAGENVTVAALRGDAFGAYLTELGPGEYDVAVWAPGHEANTTTLNVSGVDTRHDVALDPAAGASIRLYELSGAVRDVQTRESVSSTVELTLLDSPVDEGLIESYVSSNLAVIESLPGGAAGDVTEYLQTMNGLFNGTTVSVDTVRPPLGEGSFVFGGLPEGKYRVSVPDSATHVGNATNVTVGPTSKQVEFLLFARQGSVNGTVELELPDGGTVPADSATRFHLERVGTDAVSWSTGQLNLDDGSISRDGLPPGTGIDPFDPFPGYYTLEIARPGYENRTVNFTVPADGNVSLGTITLSINETQLDIEMRGTQYRVDQDGTDPENFKPIENATVVLDGTSVGSTHVEGLERQTNGDGRVEFTGIPPGSYTYTVEPTTVQGAEVEIDYPQATGSTGSVGPQNESAADPLEFYPTYHRMGFVDDDGYTTIYHPRPDPVPGALEGHFITYGDPFYRYVDAEHRLIGRETPRNTSTLTAKNFTKDDTLADEELDLTVSTVVDGTEYEATVSGRQETDSQGVLENSTVLPGQVEFETPEDPRFVEPFELDDPVSSNETVSPDPPLEPTADYIYGAVHAQRQDTSEFNTFPKITEEDDEPNEPGVLRFNPYEKAETFGPLSGVNVTLVNTGEGDVYHSVSDGDLYDADVRAGHFDIGWVPNGTYEVAVDTDAHPYSATDGGTLGTIAVGGGENRALGLRVPLESADLEYDVYCTADNDFYGPEPAYIDRETTPFAVPIFETGTPDDDAQPVPTPLPANRTWNLYAGDPATGEPLRWASQGTWTGSEAVSYSSACDTYGTGEPQEGHLEGWVFDVESWEPVPEADISVSPGGSNTTGDDGYYKVETIPGDADDYAFDLSHKYRLNDNEYSALVGEGIKRGLNAYDMYFLKDAASIEGTVEVRDRDGNLHPLEGAQITFHSEDLELRDGDPLETDANGRFQISVPPAEGATFTLRVERESDDETAPHYPVNVTVGPVDLDVGETYNLTQEYGESIKTEAIPAQPAVENLTWHHVEKPPVGFTTVPFEEGPTHFLAGVTDGRPLANGQLVFLEVANFTPVSPDVPPPELSGPGDVEPAYPEADDYVEFIENKYPIQSGHLVIERVEDGEVVERRTPTLCLRGFCQPTDKDNGSMFDISDFEPMYNESGEQIRDYRATVLLSSSHAPKSVEAAPEAETVLFSEEDIHVNRPPWAFRIASLAQSERLEFVTKEFERPSGTSATQVDVKGGPNDGVHPRRPGLGVDIDVSEGINYTIDLEGNLTKGLGTTTSWEGPTGITGGSYTMGDAVPVNITQTVSDGAVQTRTAEVDNDTSQWSWLNPFEPGIMQEIVSAVVPGPGLIETEEQLNGTWNPDDEYQLAPHGNGPSATVSEAADILKQSEWSFSLGDIINMIQIALAVGGVSSLFSIAGAAAGVAQLAGAVVLEILQWIAELTVDIETEQSYEWEYDMNRGFGPGEEGWPYDRVEPADSEFDGDSVAWRDTAEYSVSQGWFGYDLNKFGINVTQLGEWGTSGDDIVIDGCEIQYSALIRVNTVPAAVPVPIPPTGLEDFKLPPEGGVGITSCELGTSGAVHVTPYNHSVTLSRTWTDHPQYGDVNWTAGTASGTLASGTDPVDDPSLAAINSTAALLTHTHDTADEPGIPVGVASAWNETAQDFTRRPIVENLSIVETAVPDRAAGAPMTLFTHYTGGKTQLAYTTPGEEGWTPVSDANYTAENPVAVQDAGGDVHVIWRQTVTGSYREPIATLNYAAWNGTAFTEPTPVFEGEFVAHDLTHQDGPVAVVSLRHDGREVRQFSGPGLTNASTVVEPPFLPSHVAVAAAGDEIVHAWGGTVGSDEVRIGTGSDPDYRTVEGNLTALDALARGNESLLAWAEDTALYNATYSDSDGWSEPDSFINTSNVTTGISLASLPSNASGSDEQLLAAYTTETASGAEQIQFRSGDVEPAVFDIESVGTNAPVVEGDRLQATVAVTNVGGPGLQTVEVDAGPLGTNSTALDLASNESAETTLAIPTGIEQVGTYNVTVTAGNDVVDRTVAVRLPTLPNSDGPPTDSDGDDRYEDADGDGTFDIFDVQTFFEQFKKSAVQDHAWAFDFDGNDKVDIFDVQAQFDQL